MEILVNVDKMLLMKKMILEASVMINNKKKILLSCLGAIFLIIVIVYTTKQLTHAKSKNGEVKLQYLGCSAFVFSSGDGTNIGIDFWHEGAFPYAEDVPKVFGISNKDNITKLLITHEHLDHNYVPDGISAIHGSENFQVNENPQLTKINNTLIGVYKSQHFISSWGMGMLENAVFTINMNGIRMVHLGDAHGTMASEAELEKLKKKIGRIDMLFMPIGTPSLTAVDLGTLKTTMEVMKPRVIIPMHYWSLNDKKAFLSGMEKDKYKVENINGNMKKITLKELPPEGSKIIWNMTAGNYNK
jgi:L-ascorbate metabolism protein UlaG (beta-lactamase superfamily)